jgi:hypothetical protein
MAENFRELLELMRAIIVPVNDALQDHSRSITTLAKEVSRLTDLYHAEPTRKTIIESVKAEIERHDENFEDNIEQHELDCTRRQAAHVIDIVTKVEEKLKPVADLKDRFNTLLLAISISYASGVVAIGYLSWTLSQLKGK